MYAFIEYMLILACASYLEKIFVAKSTQSSSFFYNFGCSIQIDYMLA